MNNRISSGKIIVVSPGNSWITNGKIESNSDRYKLSGGEAKDYFQSMLYRTKEELLKSL